MDGALARYRRQGTLFGRYYDKVSDRVVTLVLVATLAARAHASTGDATLILLAMAYTAMLSAVSVAKWIELGMHAERTGRGEAADPGERAAPTRSAKDWARFVVIGIGCAVFVSEMDLPLWGSIAVAIGHEDWLLWYAGCVVAPYCLVPLLLRGWAVHRMDRS
jgi:phosphatidylglycerophosphate synthase